MAITKRNYVPGKFEEVSGINVGASSDGSWKYFVLDGYFKFEFGQTTLNADSASGPTLVFGTDYQLAKDIKYTTLEANYTGEDLWGMFRIINPSYFGRDIFVSGHNFGTMVDNEAMKRYIDDLEITAIHNDLEGLQGGNSTERYHTTANQHGHILDILSNGLKAVLGISSDAGEIDIYNLAQLHTAGIVNNSGLWQIKKPTAGGGGTGDLDVTGGDEAEINETYNEDGTHGGMPAYTNATGNWFIVKEGWWWIITSDKNDVWNKSAYYGSGGKDTPIGFFNVTGYNGHTGSPMVVEGGGTVPTNIDSLVADGSIYSDTIIKARNGFNVGDKMTVTEDAITLTDKSNIRFNDDGSASLEFCSSVNVTEPDDIVILEALNDAITAFAQLVDLQAVCSNGFTTNTPVQVAQVQIPYAGGMFQLFMDESAGGRDCGLTLQTTYSIASIRFNLDTGEAVLPSQSGTTLTENGIVTRKYGDAHYLSGGLDERVVFVEDEEELLAALKDPSKTEIFVMREMTSGAFNISTREIPIAQDSRYGPRNLHCSFKLSFWGSDTADVSFIGWDEDENEVDATLSFGLIVHGKMSFKGNSYSNVNTNAGYVEAFGVEAYAGSITINGNTGFPSNPKFEYFNMTNYGGAYIVEGAGYMEPNSHSFPFAFPNINRGIASVGTFNEFVVALFDEAVGTIFIKGSIEIPDGANLKITIPNPTAELDAIDIRGGSLVFLGSATIENLTTNVASYLQFFNTVFFKGSFGSTITGSGGYLELHFSTIGGSCANYTLNNNTKIEYTDSSLPAGGNVAVEFWNNTNKSSGGDAGATVVSTPVDQSTFTGGSRYRYTIVLAGAKVGDVVCVSPNNALRNSLTADVRINLIGVVTSSNTISVEIRVNNYVTVGSGSEFITSIISS